MARAVFIIQQDNRAVVSGEVLRRRTLQTRSGRAVPMQVVRPAATFENERELAAASRRWGELGRGLLQANPDAARRAIFASDTAFIAATSLRLCCILVAVSDSEHLPSPLHPDQVILGLILFMLRDDVWHIDLLTTRPEEQPGFPNPDQIRGIGSELLGEAVAQMNARLCTRIELECLDEAACRFWRARGFHDATEPLHLTCPESRVLAGQLAHTDPDRPDAGDFASAARREDLKEVSSFWRDLGTADEIANQRMVVEQLDEDLQGSEREGRDDNFYRRFTPTGSKEPLRRGESFKGRAQERLAFEQRKLRRLEGRG